MSHIRHLEFDSDDIFCSNATDLYILRPVDKENKNIIDYFKFYEKLCERDRCNNFFTDNANNRWKILNNYHIVRLYPFYTPSDGDKFYAQMLLQYLPFRDANEFLTTHQPYRESCLRFLPTQLM